MSRRLRVGMDLLWLRPGIVGGSEVAAVATLNALGAYASHEIDLYLYAQPEFVAAHPDLAGRMPVRSVAVPGEARGVRVALESSWLPFAARRDRIDVLHCYGGVVPIGVLGPSVVTVHDVQPLEDVTSYNEANFSPAKRRWLKRMIPRSVAVANRVAVPSGFVRDRIVELVGADPDKITVIPHALAADPGRDLSMSIEVRRKFSLDGPFVLFPAITYPHKNHSVLVEAFSRLADRHGDALLVLPGGAGPAEADLMELVERLGVGNRVRRVGRLRTAELNGLMSEAAVMAFPSRYEGFGLPVLEAMAADTPVVAASAGSLPEVLDDAGVLVDPDDVQGWTAALDAELDGAHRSETDTKRRRARADEFSPDRIARFLVDVYNRAAQVQSSLDSGA